MPIPDHHRKRMRSLRQTGRESTVFIRYSKKQKAWIVSESKNHNHAATEDPDEHQVHRRLQPTENQQLAELATGDCWRGVPQISRMLKTNNPHNISIPKDIRNAIQVAKHNKLGGLTNVEVAVEKLQKISWRYSFKEDENGCLTDLVYAPPEGLRPFLRFPTLITMDCTYNVIKVDTHWQ